MANYALVTGNKELSVRGRPKEIAVQPSAQEREALEALKNSGLTEVRVWRRAVVVLEWAEGKTMAEICSRSGLKETAAREWAKRFRDRRLAGLEELPGRGRKPKFSPLAGGTLRQPGLRVAAGRRRPSESVGL